MNRKQWGKKLGQLNGGIHSLSHGHARRGKMTPTYWSYKAMKNRCLNPNSPKFSLYGARGVKICARWLKSFENFLNDMGERLKGTTLDRYPNNDGNYEPGNCRWATPVEQARNRR